jgi:hypothetical protein
MLDLRVGHTRSESTPRIPQQPALCPVTLKSSRGVRTALTTMRSAGTYTVGLWLAVWFASCAMVCAQAGDTVQREKAQPRVVRLAVTEELPVKSFPGITIALPVLCSNENNLLVRPATIEAVLDPVMIGPDGRISARFGRENITEVQRAEPLYAFVRDEDVFLLVSGTTELPRQIQLRTPNGSVLHQQAVEHSTRLAHFQSDGTFAGSIELSLPFTITQFGEFASGDFLLTGIQTATGEPVAAIVNSTGQMLRSFDFKESGRAHGLAKPQIGGDESDPGKPWKWNTEAGSSSSAPFFTLQVIPDGPDLLVFSPGSNIVFFVTAGAVVRRLKLRLPTGFELETVQPGKDQLVVELTKDRNDGTGGDFAAFAIDRRSGLPTIQYEYPRDLGFGMGCVNGSDFTFLTIDPASQGIRLVKLTPTSSPVALPEPNLQQDGGSRESGRIPPALMSRSPTAANEQNPPGPECAELTFARFQPMSRSRRAARRKLLALL